MRLLPTLLLALGACVPPPESARANPQPAAVPSRAPESRPVGADGAARRGPAPSTERARADASAGAADLPDEDEAAAAGGAISEETSDAEYLWERKLMVPVMGIAPEQVADTYHAKRGARTHRALDILAPRGTPVLAADSGRILKLRRNRLGGLTIYAVDSAERFLYYYAHLSRYRVGLAEGMPVAKGEVIGYVGTTGNAPRNAPHLHFQVSRVDDLDRWWDATPINPQPFLSLEGRRVRPRKPGSHP